MCRFCRSLFVLLSFCPFSFGHCVVCRFMDSDCPFGIFKLFLHNNILFSTIKTHTFWCFWWPYYTTVSRGGVFLYVHTPPSPHLKTKKEYIYKVKIFGCIMTNFLDFDPRSYYHVTSWVLLILVKSWLQALDIHFMLPLNFLINFHL